jgi:hypothetical protein
MKITTALAVGLAALTVGTFAQAHLSIYEYNATGDLSTADSSGERHASDMAFALKTLAGRAAIIQGVNDMVLPPADAAGTDLHVKMMGQRDTFQRAPFRSLDVSTAGLVNGQPSSTTFLCLGVI